MPARPSRSSAPDASQERPAWLQEVVEDKPISELETWFNTTWDDFRRDAGPGAVNRRTRRDPTTMARAITLIRSASRRGC
ncbi:hypothetical protein [Streptomyces sp. NPDC048361]|uniref:hypothetical protein n=1 Tax=Streptomyces sp. NPDC048361 TaxID=3154720 RepID=UPI0034446027